MITSNEVEMEPMKHQLDALTREKENLLNALRKKEREVSKIKQVILLAHKNSESKVEKLTSSFCCVREHSRPSLVFSAHHSDFFRENSSNVVPTLFMFLASHISYFPSTLLTSRSTSL